MRYLLTLLLMLFFSCNSIQKKKTESNEKEQLIASIDSLFNSKIKNDEPGAAILIAYNGKILIQQNYGLRDIKDNKPITSKTNFRMASISKQFTALCILSLIDKGLVSLNDEVYKYLSYPIFKNMTIVQLINHTSGLPEYEDHFKNQWGTTKIVENKDVLHWLATSPEPEFLPGEKWQYSNTAYLMLALIVEKISGMEFSKYASENVFKKAGMYSTNYYNLKHPTDIPQRAFCYTMDSLGQYNKADGYYMNGVMGDGAVYTSIEDYFIYDTALRNETILSKKAHQLIFKPSAEHITKKGKKYQYGMGWFITDSTAYHSGGWIGTKTRVLRSLKKPLTVAVFINSEREDLSTKQIVNSTYDITNDYLKTTANNVNN